MAELLYIVSRTRPNFYDFLRKQFKGKSNVRVIFDRRFEERRRGAAGLSVERRHQRDRRSQVAAAQFRKEGWVLLRRGRVATSDTALGF